MNYQELRFQCTAHHEAAHIAVAAVQGLQLRPDGFSIDTIGEGLACFYKEPDGSDLSREQIIITMFAGYKAQRKFCAEHDLADPDVEIVLSSTDWREARELLCGMSDVYFDVTPFLVAQSNLEDRSTELVERNWGPICSLASALLEKNWETMKPLKSGFKWSTQVIAKYVECAEIIEILKPFGVSVNCLSGADASKSRELDSRNCIAIKAL